MTSIDKDLVSLFITTVILKYKSITNIELSSLLFLLALGSLTLLPVGLNHLQIVDSGLLLLCYSRWTFSRSLSWCRSKRIVFVKVSRITISRGSVDFDSKSSRYFFNNPHLFLVTGILNVSEQGISNPPWTSGERL